MGHWDLSFLLSAKTGGGTAELLSPDVEPQNCWDPSVEFRARPCLQLKVFREWPLDITLHGNFELGGCLRGNPKVLIVGVTLHPVKVRLRAT